MTKTFHVGGVQRWFEPTCHTLPVNNDWPNQAAQLFDAANALTTMARLGEHNHKASSTCPTRFTSQNAILDHLEVSAVLGTVAAFVEVVQLPTTFVESFGVSFEVIGRE